MTLRAQVREAIDDIAPPAPDLEALVVAAAFPSAARPPRRAARARRGPHLWRGAMAIAASCAAIVLMVGLVVGGRLWLTVGPPATAGQIAGLKSLESRPLNLPTVGAGEQCPVGPMTTGMYGSELVATENGTGPTTRWGTYVNADAVIDGAIRGPILVRARDLRTGAAVVFVGEYTAGPSVGADNVDGRVFALRTELVLDAGHPPTIGSESHMYTPDHVYWGFMFGLPKGSSGCVGWQIDNQAFSETFVSSGTAG